MKISAFFSVLLAGSLIASPLSAQAVCGDDGVYLQILGSGGPFGMGRASAGYLVWIDGTARIMVDAGGGTFTRFHEAGAEIAELDLLALSHFHPDHSTEVPGLLWTQSAGMLVAGPSGNEGFPSVAQFVDGLFGREGVFRAVTNGNGMETVMVDVSATQPTEVFRDGALRVRGIGVPHADVPAVGYRIDVGEVSIAFSTDQNGSDPAWAAFASGADVFVAHVAGSESISGYGAALHATPSVWGQMATDAQVGLLVLSHLSRIPPGGTGNADGAPPGFGESLSFIQANWSGPLVIAEDLMCIAVGS